MAQHLMRRRSAPWMRPLPFEKASPVDASFVNLIPGGMEEIEPWKYATNSASLPEVLAPH
ncbi:hypothetical protein [Synechococcus sp. CS-1332]|uniref:hypothetical protein n=1 Tax=Synechococcus sp. CS-1332 TaxID=2847972 RepID=UPI00223B8289|nr:hypothetical protein [Synechococcus sp. CS-1332]MCT0206361.1 hypothetical protein [Synechococcus sp. CS-1332]